MAGPEITKLKKILRENAAATPADITIEERRKGMESRSFPVADDIKVETLTVAGRPAEWIDAPGADASRAILYLHGGGYVMGSLVTHRCLAGELSRAAGARVLLLDYRLAPEDPYPAAVEDAVAAYQWLLDQGFAPERLAISGDSAGGGLTVATLLSARDKGLAMPAGAVPISPWADMTCSHETYATRAEHDPMVALDGIQGMAKVYLGGADPRSPYASPNHGDLKGLPPMLIHVGDHEVLLGDSLDLEKAAKAAGVDITLEVWDEMIHVWHAFHPMLPEGKDGIRRVGEWLNERWGASAKKAAE